MIWVWLCHLFPGARRLALIWTKWAPCLVAVILIAIFAAEAWSRLDLITSPRPSPSCESRPAKLNWARHRASPALSRSAPPMPDAQPTYTWPHCQTALCSLALQLSLSFLSPWLVIHFIEPLIDFLCCSCYPKTRCSIFKVLWWFMHKASLGIAFTHTQWQRGSCQAHL